MDKGEGGLVIADMGGGGVNFLQFCANVFYEQPLNNRSRMGFWQVFAVTLMG